MSTPKIMTGIILQDLPKAYHDRTEGKNEIDNCRKDFLVLQKGTYITILPGLLLSKTIYIHIYIYTHTHTHIYIYYTYIYKYIYIYMRIYKIPE